jgi:hypothetical protein
MALDLEASVSLGLGKLDDIHKGVTGLHEPKPLIKKAGTANNPSALTTQTLIIPQYPAAGRMWYVSRVVLLGADGHTPVATATGDVYAGPSPGLVDAPSQMYSGLTIPTIIEEGRYHNPVLHGEVVYVILTNLPAQQQVQFAIGYYEYPVASVVAMGIG